MLTQLWSYWFYISKKGNVWFITVTVVWVKHMLFVQGLASKPEHELFTSAEKLILHMWIKSFLYGTGILPINQSTSLLTWNFHSWFSLSWQDSSFHSREAELSLPKASEAMCMWQWGFQSMNPPLRLRESPKFSALHSKRDYNLFKELALFLANSSYPLQSVHSSVYMNVSICFRILFIL